VDKKQTLDALSALSQETRLDVFRLLVNSEPDGLRAGDIADRLGVRQNTMSANLGILERAGLISGIREGRSIRYVANLESMRALLRFLMEDCCGGEPERCAPLLDDFITMN
jgi:ArsR family transcriptional regulator